MQAALDLSERIALISVSSTMKVAADADRLRREGVDVVDFGAGEPDFPTPDNIKQAAINAINDNFTKYTPAGGTQELKQALCDRHREDYGTNYSPAECVVSVGGKHVIFNLAQVLLNPGDEVIIPVPYWVTYKDVVNYTGAKCVFVDTDEANGFTLTASMIEPYMTDKTRMVIINSPSNPSGGVLERDEFEQIFQLTSRRGIWLMTDECYCRFVYDSEPYSIAATKGAKDTVLVAGSLSKTYSMTGWRIGFGLGPAAVMASINKLQSHSTSNPTSIAQKAAVEAVRGPQESVGIMLAEYARRRDFVIERLRQIPGVKITVPKGAFYAYPDISCALQKERHAYTDAVCRAASRESARCRRAGRGFWNRQAHPYLLRGVDGGSETRSRSDPQVHRRSMSVRLIEPRFVERVWGTTRLSPLFPDQDRKIGEVWFDAGSSFPLLVKFIFTSEKLSVQVHPGRRVRTTSRELARQDGNVAHSGGRTSLDDRARISANRERAAVCEPSIDDETVESLLNWVPVKAGRHVLRRSGYGSRDRGRNYVVRNSAEL